jgi:hypothetical protein
MMWVILKVRPRALLVTRLKEDLPSTRKNLKMNEKKPDQIPLSQEESSKESYKTHLRKELTWNLL